MKNNKRKIIAYLTAYSMFLSGCKMELENLFNKDQVDTSKNDFTTSATTNEPEESRETIQTEVIEENITMPRENEVLPSTEPSIPETEVPTTQQEETEPATEPTEPETEPPEEETQPIIIPADTSLNYEFVSATTDVNMRSSNTASSIIIDVLKENDTAIKIFSCDNNWDLVKYNNQIGYVCRDYLEYTGEFVESEYKHTKHNDIVLTTTELNFRIGPTTDAKKISIFDKGTELQVIAKVDNGWLLVKHNGIIGYVHGDYVVSLLELANLEYPELNLTELDVKKIVYSTTDLNIRKGNSTDYEIIGGLEQYESTRVLGEYDGWYFIMTNEYTFGFVSKKYTKDLENIFVVVDLSEQRLYLYNEDELYYVTPVTTGKDSTPSDIGLFKIYNKETDRVLTDNETYWSHVDYWMPYNRGEGLHDADWRSVFGKQNYKTSGSHGCINMPPEITDEIYETVSVGTRVLVHK